MGTPKFESDRDMLIDGAAATQCIDSSGEVVEIDGVDCSQMDEAGAILCNWEHEPGEKGASTIVGRVVYLKKIHAADECDTPRQRMYWDKTRGNPYIYVVCRLFDGSGHAEARNIAAIIRDNDAHGEPLACRFSVEGSTLKKEGNRIKTSIFRRLAITIRPCNKTAITGLVADPGGEHLDKGEPYDPRFTPLGGSVELEVDPRYDATTPLARVVLAAVALRSMAKALEAGSPDGAPSTRTGGAALQREDVALRGSALKALKGYDWSKPFRKEEFRAYAKAHLPEVSDQFLNHFEGIADSYAMRKGLYEAELLKAETGLDLGAAEAQTVGLRSSLQQLLQPVEPLRPRVYALDLAAQGRTYPAGRYMLTPDGMVHHLEDYHGLLAQLLPEGPMHAPSIARLHGSFLGPGLRVTPHLLEGEAPEPAPAEGTGGQLQVVEQPPPLRAPVFRYQRPGWLRAHTLEFGPHGAALDGQPVTDDELKLMMHNVQSGLAQVRYGGAPMGDLAKATHNETMATLEGRPPATAAEEMSPDQAMQHMRTALGHNHPAVQALAQHIYEDRMVPGVGNKYAYTQFRNQQKPGVYVSIDANHFKSVNDTFGHDAGDRAIQGIGTALREASAKVGTGKLFRPGGDEFVAHFPTFEHAAQFARHATQHLDQIPPVEGQHKLSASFGFGHDFATADRALYAAKAQKLDPATGRSRYTPQNTPHLAHSMVPGAEGPMNPPHEHPPVQHLPTQLPKAPATPKPAAPVAA